MPLQHMYRANFVEVIYKEPFDPGYFKNLKKKSMDFMKSSTKNRVVLMAGYRIFPE